MEEPTFSELRQRFRLDPLALLGQVPGVFAVDKPPGMTSHDVVAIARKRLNMRKIGHGGTLDPLATGVLLILAGRATRLFDKLQTFEKEYVSRFRLGERTDTHDIAGSVIARSDAGVLPIERSALETILANYRGEIQQVPPMYSALKKNGKKLVDMARAGKVIERDARPVRVRRLELVAFDGIEGELMMCVSKGFYVRSLIDDIGRSLGSYAVMTALRRTRIGPFGLEPAIAPEDIAPLREG